MPDLPSVSPLPPPALHRTYDHIIPDSCGGLLGGNCPSDFFCSYPLGACGDAILGGSSEAGVCKPLPMFCSAHIDPVCACNGRALETFTNECMANMKGFSVKVGGWWWNCSR